RVEHVGPALAEQVAELRGRVCGEAGPAARGYLLPRRLRGAAGARVDQMMLELAAAQPAALRAPARGEAAGDELHRAAARDRDRQTATRGEVSTGRDVAVAREERERVVDGHRLYDAVQVEESLRRELHAERGRAHLAPAPPRAGAGRARITSANPLEVVVVAGSLNGSADRRIEHAVRRAGEIERRSERAGERRRDADEPALSRVHAVKFALGPKAAEDAVTLVEERAHGLELRGRRAGDDDLAAHCPETCDRAHDTDVDA